jgi:hypothetical protein
MDVRDFLERGAATPVVRLDARRLAVLDARRRRVRWFGWLGGLAAVVGLVAGGAPALAPAGRTRADAGRRPAPSMVADAPTLQTAATDGPHGLSLLGGGGGGGSKVATGPASEASGSVAPSSSGAPAAAAREAQDDRDLAADEGCEARPGETCSYTATVPGGYRGYGLYRIVIRRGGATLVYETPPEDQAKPYPCRDVGFIQPGDFVTATSDGTSSGPQQDGPPVTSPFSGKRPPPPPTSTTPGSIGVGPSFHC